MFLIPDARNVFPFLLEEELIAQGANFSGGERYLEKVSVDGKLVTGQNPWSVWDVAESMIKQLGFEVRPREVTAEEHSVDILSVYEKNGFSTALSHMQSILNTSGTSVDKLLIAMHGVVSVMDWDFPKTLDLLRLLHHAAKDDASAGRQNIRSSDYYSRIAFISKYKTSAYNNIS